jgi:hypothetical protein
MDSRAFAIVALIAGVWSVDAVAWGPEGHSIIAEVAQHRLNPQARAEVDRLLGTNHSLASVGSWADNVRDDQPETYNWHFVDMPLADDKYDPTKHCKQSDRGDCVVAELERLKTELRCAATDDQKAEALRYTVHFIGDIHQPLHTVDEARGGNDIAVEVRLAGAKTCKGAPCPIRPSHSNFHAVWDSTLIKATTWSWGAYVDRLEDGWLTSPGSAERRWRQRPPLGRRRRTEKPGTCGNSYRIAMSWTTPTMTRSCRRSIGSSD